MTSQFDLQVLRSRLLPESSVLKSEQGLPVAAVAIIINPNDRGGSVLLIKRTEREGDPWSSQIAFPGGHKSPKDQDFLETAIREAREEVGIQLHEHELLGILPLVSARSHRVRVAPFVFQLKTTVTVHSNDEIAESFWIPLNTLSGLRMRKSVVRVADGTLTVDSYIYNKYVIWGLTFRTINLLLAKDIVGNS